MKLPEQIFNRLVNFMHDELQEKVVDGITYVLKNGSSEADKTAIKEYIGLRKQIEDEMGNEEADNIFRAYTIKNGDGVTTGIVFDLNIDVMSDIMKKLQEIAKEQKIPGLDERDLNEDLIANGPAERRKKDIVLMAETVAKRFKENSKNGTYNYTVAMYCRNKTPKISINGVDSKGNVINIKYDAFALRHFDLAVVGRILGEKYGIKLKSAAVKEVLPSKTGISYSLVLEGKK